jgi:uncharacterized protein (DUF2252 family)
LRRSWKQPAKDRIEDINPTIPLGRRFWPLVRDEKLDVQKLFQREEIRHLATLLHSRDDQAAIRVLDAAYWMMQLARTASVRRVLGIDEPPYEGDSLCLMDIKEATQAAAPRR